MSRIYQALVKAALLSEPLSGGTTIGPSMVGTAVVSERSNDDVTAAVGISAAGALSKEALSTKYVLAHCVRAGRPTNQDKNLARSPGPLAKRHILEQFGTLWTRLRQSSAKRVLKTLVITSSLPREGRTFVTKNLAEFIARYGNRPVLMIDADMRRGGLKASVSAPCLPGLTDYLNGGIDEMAVIQRGQNDNLFLISRGRSATNTSELLGNGLLQVLFDRIGPAFEWVLVDCPPCLALADVSVIADICDGALLVVKMNSTSAPLVHRACQELKSRNLVGVVLNAPDTYLESTARGQHASSYISPDSSDMTFSFKDLRPAMGQRS
jgi:protein-tyrosine kinase